MLTAPSSSARSRRSRVTQALSVWAPPVAWAVLIYYLSSLPGSTIPSPFRFADKVFHLGVYAVLGFFVARALVRYINVKYALVPLACFICIIYGVCDEFHQSSVPGRDPRFMDVVADGVGSFLGIMVCLRARLKT